MIHRIHLERSRRQSKSTVDYATGACGKTLMRMSFLSPTHKSCRDGFEKSRLCPTGTLEMVNMSSKVGLGKLKLWASD